VSIAAVPGLRLVRKPEKALTVKASTAFSRLR
jgi:hypothetical protein